MAPFFAMTALANPIAVVSEGEPTLLPTAIPLLFESLIIAFGARFKGLKFSSTLAFWFLATHLTFLPAQWLYDQSRGILDLALVEIAIVLVETLIFRVWSKKNTGEASFIYPMFLIFIGNLVSWILGGLVIAIN